MKGPEHSVVMIDVAAQRDRDIEAGKPQTLSDYEWIETLAVRCEQVEWEITCHSMLDITKRRQLVLEVAATAVAWLEDYERKHTPDRWRKGT